LAKHTFIPNPLYFISNKSFFYIKKFQKNSWAFLNLFVSPLLFLWFHYIINPWIFTVKCESSIRYIPVFFIYIK
jgi:hypothetical protein